MNRDRLPKVDRVLVVFESGHSILLPSADIVDVGVKFEVGPTHLDARDDFSHTQAPGKFVMTIILRGSLMDIKRPRKDTLVDVVVVEAGGGHEE